jgi:hypothetical protein
MRVDMGYLGDFGDHGPTILIDGDGAGLLALAERLRGLELSDAEPVGIHCLPFVTTHNVMELTAHPVGRELGVRIAGLAPGHFSWNHSEEGWLEAAEKIELLANNGGGHNWLGCIGPEDACVLVTMNEYGQAFWLGTPTDRRRQIERTSRSL